MEINLHILNLKKFSDEELMDIAKELRNLKIQYGTLLYHPFENLKNKVYRETSRRERSRFVFVEFRCEWSGYSNNPSAPRKLAGKFYRKISKDQFEKMPKFFSHQFRDNSANDWTVKKVDFLGRDEGSYSNQIDEWFKKYSINKDEN